jgi:hypothetical protein
MLHVHASEVAKLIGENPFETQEASLITVLARTSKWRHLIAKTRLDLGLLTEQQVLDQAQDALKQGVAQACAASSEAEISKAVEFAVDEARRKHELKLLESSPKLEGLKEQVDAHMRVAQPVIEAAIVKERGIQLEQAVLNGYESKHDTTVDMRNSQRYQLRGENYVITGYIDGFDSVNNVLIEVKNRRRHWRMVPVYDLIQMRVYLAMLAPHKDSLSGKLVERFPDGTVRETSVPNCDKEWARIQTELCKVSKRAQALTEEDVINMVISHSK